MIAPVSTSGTICFYVYGTAHLIADVSGYFPTGKVIFKPLTPQPGAGHTRRAARSAMRLVPALRSNCRCGAREVYQRAVVGAVALNVTVVER